MSVLYPKCTSCVVNATTYKDECTINDRPLSDGIMFNPNPMRDSLTAVFVEYIKLLAGESLSTMIVTEDDKFIELR